MNMTSNDHPVVSGQTLSVFMALQGAELPQAVQWLAQNGPTPQYRQVARHVAESLGALGARGVEFQLHVTGERADLPRSMVRFGTAHKFTPSPDGLGGQLVVGITDPGLTGPAAFDWVLCEMLRAVLSALGVAPTIESACTALELPDSVATTVTRLLNLDTSTLPALPKIEHEPFVRWSTSS